MNLGKLLNYMMYQELSQFNSVYYKNFLSLTQNCKMSIMDPICPSASSITVNIDQMYLSYSSANIIFPKANPRYHITLPKNFTVVF